MMPNGTLIKNIQRQSATLVINPPSGGPIIGAISAGQVSVAMAVMSRCFGVVRRTASRPTGTISAPPTPCKIRIATKLWALVARPQNTEETVKMASARLKMVRAPKRSAIQPLAGMSTASVIR